MSPSFPVSAVITERAREWASPSRYEMLEGSLEKIFISYKNDLSGNGYLSIIAPTTDGIFDIPAPGFYPRIRNIFVGLLLSRYLI